METTVKTRYGLVKGTEQEGALCFLGIPFAKAPVGELRFRRPRPCEPWEGVLDCTSYGHYCPQVGVPMVADKHMTPSEDCLNLNIYTPAADGGKRPVVLFIHGGAYVTGSAADALAVYDRLSGESDIVFVSCHYRLGPLGNIDFSSLSGAGDRFDVNCGTWDQLAALDWVIENISAFGGDPEEITLSGVSAGATAVMTLIASPYVKGKVKRVCMESLCPFLPLTRENGRAAALEVIGRLGIREEEAYKVADLPAEELVKAVNDLEHQYMDIRPYTVPAGPVVDGDLVPELPFDALLKGAADGVDFLLGTTRDEASLFATGMKDMDVLPVKEEQVDRYYRDNPAADKEKQLSLYPKYPSFRSFQHLGKEIFFHSGVMALAEGLSRRGNDVYLYHFEWSPLLLKMFTLGAMHGLTNAMLSGKKNGLMVLFSGPKGRRVTSILQKHWISFYRTGDVNEGTEEWKSYGEEKNTFCISDRPVLKQDPFRKEEEAFRGTRPYGQ